MKTCTKCGESKPNHAFDVHRGRKVRHARGLVLKSECRECNRAATRERMRRKRAEAKRQAQSTKENST